MWFEEKQIQQIVRLGHKEERKVFAHWIRMQDQERKQMQLHACTTSCFYEEGEISELELAER